MREVTIYPLSMADQFKLTDILVEVFEEFMKFDDLELDDAATVETAISVIRKNLEQILDIITDENETISFDELTNEQFSELAVLLYEVNYEGALGNLKSLIGKVKKSIKLPSMRQLQTSSDISQATD